MNNGLVKMETFEIQLVFRYSSVTLRQSRLHFGYFDTIQIVFCSIQKQTFAVLELF